MAPVPWSDASEVLSLRWDDGTFVVDPDSTVRKNRGVRDGDAAPESWRSLDSLDGPLEALTLEEWRRQNGYDPETRTYG